VEHEQRDRSRAPLGDEEPRVVGSHQSTIHARSLPFAEMVISMFMRRDPHTLGAAAFKTGNLTPEWPHRSLACWLARSA
jgi:hypothetical protein